MMSDSIKNSDKSCKRDFAWFSLKLKINIACTQQILYDWYNDDTILSKQAILYKNQIWINENHICCQKITTESRDSTLFTGKSGRIRHHVWYKNLFIDAIIVVYMIGMHMIILFQRLTYLQTKKTQTHKRLS